jgi:hypothetical protein
MLSTMRVEISARHCPCQTCRYGSKPRRLPPARLFHIIRLLPTAARHRLAGGHRMRAQREEEL